MIYYKLGYDAIKGYAAEGARQWAEFGAAKPAVRKGIVIGAALLFVFLLFSSLAPTYVPDYDPTPYLTGAANKIGGAS